MAIKPILFNTEMVRAILDGRKSCTRRLVKTRRKAACGFYVTKKVDGTFSGIYEYDENESMFDNPLMPPYQPGDVLYVRETWCALPVNEAGHMRGHSIYYYRADGDLRPEEWRGKWRPSIHMPKEAARIWLKVTDVRVEQLHDITPKDAENEGVGNLFYEDIGYSEKNYGTEVDPEYGIAKEQFAWLWESTIKKSDLSSYGWDANPYVWVISFERCEKPEE